MSVRRPADAQARVGKIALLRFAITRQLAKRCAGRRMAGIAQIEMRIEIDNHHPLIGEGVQ
jgi:hypothetical protein